LRKHGVDATIIAEEAGRIEGKNGFVIIDAIDGTTNATRRVPFYCCSIAFATDFKLSAVTDAAIIDLTTGSLYHAVKGKGAFLNGRRIATASNDDLAVSMNISSVGPEITERLSPVIMKAKHVRQFGSVALEMCYLARGSLDAYIDFRGKVRPTDIAGACLIVKEAGGILHSEKSEELDSDLDINTHLSFLAAANGKVLKELSGLFR
jgi:myo-inositol-1(or 4)-monophosphatase